MKDLNELIKETDTLCTHAGGFHSDDVMFTAIFFWLCDRTGRERPVVKRLFKVPDEIANDEHTLVFDIGGGRFDHHSDEREYRENGIPYASVGKFWRAYGEEICRIAGASEPEEMAGHMDRALICDIDANDNGVTSAEEMYEDCHTASLPKIIKLFNPNWIEDFDRDQCFMEAVAFAQKVFERELAQSLAKDSSRSLMAEAISNIEEGSPVLALDRSMPWKDAILNSEDPKAEDILFVVYPSNRGGWNWQGVPDAPGSFGQRHPVPLEWRGKEDEELAAACGIPDATFCHASGFMGSCKTREGAIAMAEKASAAPVPDAAFPPGTCQRS